MAVVQVRIMRVPMPHRFMPVRVGMRLAHRAVMGVLMMRVMAVQMVMLHRAVPVVMVMPLGQMQP